MRAGSSRSKIDENSLSVFDRNFFTSVNRCSRIGTGAFGGKANSLVLMQDILKSANENGEFPEITVQIPRMAIVATDYFDAFMEQNKLYEIALSDSSDYQIAHAFQKASLPPMLVGDLMALVNAAHQPLAIRSSSLMEDAMYEPFAGIYATKMLPNNEINPDKRFKKLDSAIKLIYASTFFRAAKDYLAATGKKSSDEKMAVIIQEIVGQKFDQHFYPHISGVARSYNFYSSGYARPEDGVISLALGLGRTIVDDGISWNYSPPYPHIFPPYNDIDDLLRQSQTRFWAVNMGEIARLDPIKETECMLHLDITTAERQKTLDMLVSTYDVQSDRIYTDCGNYGPKLLSFAPILQLNTLPLNDTIVNLLRLSEEALGTKVEIEFAVTLPDDKSQNPKLGFLQVRPMVVSNTVVDLGTEDLQNKNVLVASTSVLGNGIKDNISHIMLVKPETFNAAHSREIANEIGEMNRFLLDEGEKYLLIGFGRWGSSDPWLGIPVHWGQISAAAAVVESTLPEMNVDLSQGTHFFHNISSFQVSYFSVKHSGKYKIDWEWMNSLEVMQEKKFTKLIKANEPLSIKVDGRSGTGVILR